MAVNQVLDLVMFCNASDVGFGAFVNSDVDSHLQNMELFSNWTDSESLESSTWGELEYTEIVNYTCSDVLENKQVKIN